MKIELMKYVPKSVGGLIGKARVGLAVHGPTIMVVSGVATMIAGTIVACKRTRKADTIVNIYKSRMSLKDRFEATSDETKRRITFDMAKDLVKVYALPVGLLGSGAALILVGHGKMSRRCLYWMGEYTVLERAYNQLLEETDTEELREEDDYEEENEIYHPVKVDPKAKYRRVFGPGNKYWNPYRMDMNFLFLKNAQRNAQTKYDLFRKLILNDVLPSIGFPICASGALSIWSKDMPGDDFIDFGIEQLFDDYHNGIVTDRDLMYGIPLNFNVNGLIPLHDRPEDYLPY